MQEQAPPLHRALPLLTTGSTSWLLINQLLYTNQIPERFLLKCFCVVSGAVLSTVDLVGELIPIVIRSFAHAQSGWRLLCWRCFLIAWDDSRWTDQSELARCSSPIFATVFARWNFICVLAGPQSILTVQKTDYFHKLFLNLVSSILHEMLCHFLLLSSLPNPYCDKPLIFIRAIHMSLSRLFLTLY